MKSLVLISLLILSGCAITDEERYERLAYTNAIEKDFLVFVSDCNFFDGELRIDLPIENRRVHNAPITVWEMQHAECWYDDSYFPTRMR